MVDEASIHAIFKKYLGRSADPIGLAGFSKAKSPIDVEYGVVGSDEFRRNDLLIQLPRGPVAWKICLIKEAKIIFVPIAKNAHSSILRAFLEFEGINWKSLPILDGLVGVNADENTKMHSVLECNRTGLLFKDYSPSYINEILNSNEYIRVSVFRNPEERLYSSFNHFFIQGLNNPEFLRHINSIMKAFDVDTLDKNIKNFADIWFKRLVKFILNTSPSAVDPHFAPQYQYIQSLKVDYAIPIERLDLLELIVSARSGKKLNIKHYNVRNSGELSLSGNTIREVGQAIRDVYWIDSLLYEKANNMIEQIEKDFRP